MHCSLIELAIDVESYIIHAICEEQAQKLKEAGGLWM